MGTHYQGSKKEVRVLNAYIKLIRAVDSLQSTLSRKLNDDGLTISQFGVLDVLYHLGQMNQKDIAHKLLISGSNLVTVLDNLEKNNYVKRERDKVDRRNTIVHLTDKGNATISKVFKRHLNDLVDEFSSLNNGEVEELGRICKKLGVK